MPLTKRILPAAAYLAAGILLPALALAPGAASAQTKPAAQKAQPQPQQPREPQPAQIDRNGVLILVRSVLTAVNQANATGNYTVLRDLGAPGFREANTASRLSDVFAGLRAQKVDLSGLVVLDPQLTLLPQIEANGLMHMAGYFPSAPNQINFELLFAPVEGRWQLFGVSVNIAPSTPAAPGAPPAPQAAAQPPAHHGSPAQHPAPEPGAKPAAPAAKPKS